MSAQLGQKIRFTQDQVNTIYRMQAEANDVMSTAWRTSTNSAIAYYRAGMVEAIESLMWYGFKWWKKEIINITRVKEELIDILHFGVSDSLRNIITMHSQAETPYDIDSFIRHYSMYDMNNEELAQPMQIGRFACGTSGVDLPTDEHGFTFLDLVDQFVFYCTYYGKVPMDWLMLMFDKLEMDNNEVTGMYLAKNLLNKFRTANGAKEGTYYKVWAGREDQEHLTDYLEQLKILKQEPTVEAINYHLTTTYARYLSEKQVEFK